MPTGYTCYIHDGKVDNLADYMRICSHAFSYDSQPSFDLPDFNLDADLYYRNEAISNVEDEIEKLENLTTEQLEALFDIYHLTEISTYKNLIEKEDKLSVVYDSIRNEMRQWNCPNEIIELKEFMYQQLDVDNPDSSYYRKRLKEIQTTYDQRDILAYRESKLNRLKSNLKDYLEDRNKLFQRMKKNDMFIDTLKTELNKLEKDKTYGLGTQEQT